MQKCPSDPRDTFRHLVSAVLSLNLNWPVRGSLELCSDFDSKICISGPRDRRFLPELHCNCDNLDHILKDAYFPHYSAFFSCL